MQRELVRAIASVRNALILVAAIIIVAVAIGVVVTYVSTPADAQEREQAPMAEEFERQLTVPCGTTPYVQGLLRTRYLPEPFIVGAAKSGMFTLWVNPTTGEFAVVMSSRSGTSCIIDAGKGFGITPEVLELLYKQKEGRQS